MLLVGASAQYADYHQRRYESRIGDDGVLGDPWADILKSARVLLNGECGRLDCGTVDGLICEMLEAEGFDVDTGDRAWRLDPPSVVDQGGYSRSIDVLVKTATGEKYLGYRYQDDPDSEPRWKEKGRDGYDIADVVGWLPIPA